MSRRTVEIGSLLIAGLALAIVLVNATLVDRRPPTIERVTLSAVAGDDRLAQTVSAIDVVFSEPVQARTVEERFTIEPRVGGTFTWNGPTMIFTPSAKLPADTAFAITIDAGFIDASGNVATAGLEPWAFRTIGPPTIAATEPIDESAGVAVDGTVSLTFDRLMDTGAVEAAFSIEPPTAHRFSWSGQVLSVAFEDALAFGTRYTVTVGSDATDTDGSRLSEPFVTRFTTVAAGLQIEQLVPRPDVAGISVRTPIAIVFDGPIDAATADEALQITPQVAGQLEVVDLGDDRPVSEPSPTGSPAPGRVLLFTPSAALAAHTTYTITLAPVIARAGAPGEVAEGRTWSFTTGQLATSVQNQVAFLSARSGVRNVWLMNPDGSNSRQLTAELVPVAGFDVTADGGRIAYSAGGVVRLMRVDGSETTILTADGFFEYAPLILPDARSIVVGRRDAAGTDLGYWLVPLPGSSGGEPRQLLPAGAPEPGSTELGGEGILADGQMPPWMRRGAVTPDSGALLLVTGSGELAIMGLGETAVAVPLSLRAGAAPVWDVASESFLVVGDTGGGSGLWSIRLDGSRRQLFPAVGSVSVGPSGTIATVVDGPANEVHVVRGGTVTSPAPVTLTTGADLLDRWPSLVARRQIGPVRQGEGHRAGELGRDLVGRRGRDRPHPALDRRGLSAVAPIAVGGASPGAS